MTLQEQPFSSRVPVLGTLIVAVRTLWSSVATKWFVRPLVHQQNVFNAEVVSYLEGQSLDLAENIGELTAIAERLARIEEGIREASSGGSGRGRQQPGGDAKRAVAHETGERGKSNG